MCFNESLRSVVCTSIHVNMLCACVCVYEYICVTGLCGSVSILVFISESVCVGESVCVCVCVGGLSGRRHVPWGLPRPTADHLGLKMKFRDLGALWLPRTCRCFRAWVSGSVSLALVFAEHLDLGALPHGPPGSDCCLRSRTGTWHSFLQCCNPCTWTHLSSSSKIQRNCMGLKITVCIGRWGKFLNPKDIKRPKNPTATFEEPGAKAGYCACLLHSIPLKGGGKIPKATLSARPLDTPLCCA